MSGNTPLGFTWLLSGRLAGVAQPESAADMAALAELGVQLLVSLRAETPPDVGAIKAVGMQSHYLPIRDFDVPDMDAARETCALVAEFLARGSAVVYHCRAGKGRTGTMLAAQMIWSGQSAQEAIEFTRACNPEWIETQGQLDFLPEFAATIR